MKKYAAINFFANNINFFNISFLKQLTCLIKKFEYYNDKIIVLVGCSWQT